MSEEASKYVICEHDQPAVSIKGSVARTETILLCRNSLVSIGLKHLLEGTRFAIASTASNPGSFSHLYPNATPTLVIVDGSDGVNSLAETVTTLKGQYPQARIALISVLLSLREVQGLMASARRQVDARFSSNPLSWS